MKHKQQGVAVLLLTSLILALALVASMVSYRTTFYQIKRAHNEVQSRQEHWRAEGGLECAYAKTKIEQNYTDFNPTDSPAYFASQCSTPLGIGAITAQPSTIAGAPTDTYDVTVSARTDSRGAKHTKSILLDDSLYSGAIQTSSDIYFDGDFDIAPATGGLPDSNGDYDCTAIRFANTVNYTHSGTLALETTNPTKTGVSCQVQTKVSTTTSLNGAPSANDPFEKDYKHQANIDTFFNYFGVTKTAANITTLKGGGYHQVTPATAADCGTEIFKAFVTQGKTKVWVTGNCYISGPVSIMDGAGVQTPRSLVVQDGLFATNASLVFDGAFIQFFKDASYYDEVTETFDATALASEWTSMSVSANVSSNVSADSVYVDFGSFFPKGGIYLDARNASVKMKASNNLYYSDAYKVHATPKAPIWIKGSWDDR